MDLTDRPDVEGEPAFAPLVLRPYRMEDLSLRSRVVMPALTRCRADNPGLVPNELMARYYAQRASAGLIVSEGTWVSARGIGINNVPGLFTREQVEGWRQVTDAVHARGGTMFAQLWHGGAMSHPDYWSGQAPLGASAVNPKLLARTKAGWQATVTPRAMTAADLRAVVTDFAIAATNAREAGFDGVQIQASFQYLFAQFLHTGLNVRTDAYGGSVENRARLLVEVLDAVLERMGGKHVGLKVGPSSDEAGLMTANADTMETYDYVLNRLNEYDLAHVQIMGTQTAVSTTPIASLAGDGMFLRARPRYRGTLIVNAAFDFERANRALREGWADLVAFGRPYIANPDLVERFRDGGRLNARDKSTAYTSGPRGYTDYPLAEDRKPSDLAMV